MAALDSSAFQLKRKSQDIDALHGMWVAGCALLSVFSQGDLSKKQAGETQS